MEMPLLIQEKMLAGVHRQIRMAVRSLGSHIDDPLVISMCVAPWDIPGLFGLPTGDPTSVVDGYELRAICFGPTTHQMHRSMMNGKRISTTTFGFPYFRPSTYGRRNNGTAAAIPVWCRRR